MHGRDVNGDAGCRLVMLVKRSAFAEAADWQRIAAEAPRAQAEPAEVFHCVAAMRKFPVEHAAQSLLIHPQIAGAKITVNTARQIGRAECRERGCKNV